MKLLTTGVHALFTCCICVTLAAAGPEATDEAASPTEQAAALAVNRLKPTADGVLLRHPRRTVEFAPDGLRLTSRRGAPEWRWSLEAISTADGRLIADTSAVAPVVVEQNLIRYDRCTLLEDYRLKVNSFEQLLVIPKPLSLVGEDLVVSGAVDCDGDLVELESGWAWRSARGEVTMGRVSVFDATGARIPASFEVSKDATRIVVDGGALLVAAYPVTIDPEIGANDFRISDMGPDGDADYDAWEPAVAYNATDDQFLVVWYGDDSSSGNVDEEFEVFGQALDAGGTPLPANDVRISFAGGTGDPTYGAFLPDVAWNSTSNEYLVVWSADNPEDGCVNQELEIWGQVVDASVSPLYGGNFRISFAGGSGDPTFDADYPAVAYNPFLDEYLAVWQGDDSTGGLVNDELEIWAQRVGSAGLLVGSNLRVSDMGGTGDLVFDAMGPDVAYNSQENQYLIVWHGDDDTGGLVNDEYEIYGQLIDATGGEIGPNDLRLSDMGGTGDQLFDASFPSVVVNSAANEYLVAWRGDDTVGGLVDGELEVFCQRLDADLNELGGNDLRLSDVGGVGDPGYGVASGPELSYNPALDQYLVVWAGEDNSDGMVDGEWEVFAQALTREAQGVGPNDERISDAGDLGNATYTTAFPVVAANSSNGQFLVAWYGDDDVGGLIPGEWEVFIQRVYIADIFADGFESGDTAAWSAAVP